MIDYIEHQKHISDNVIIRDNVLERSLCGEYIVKILYKGSLNGMWNANIEYGHEKKPQWPINEWVYAIAEPETDKFISTHTSEDGNTGLKTSNDLLRAASGLSAISKYSNAIFSKGQFTP